MDPQNERSEPKDENCHLLLCSSPSWARPLATRKVFTLCYGFLSVVQGMSFMFIVATLTTIESHFQLPSETFGLVMSVGEIACIITGVVAGLLVDNKTHRPYGLGICLLLLGIGSNLFALPYYIYGSPIPLDNTINGTSTHTLCVENSSYNIECMSALLAPPDSSQWTVGLLFLLAYSISNVGRYYFPYENGPAAFCSVCRPAFHNRFCSCTLMCSIRTVGPIFGSFLSTFCLALYVNPNTTMWFDNRDSRWVGAWWLGYVIIGWLCVLCAFLIAQFPRRLPTKQLTPAMQMEMEERTPMANSDGIAQDAKDVKDKDSTTMPTFKEMIPSIRRTLGNFMLWLRILSETFTWFGLEGFMLYMPKYLEHEFHITASQASMWTGSAFLFPSVVGDLVVGFLVQRFQPTTKQLAGILTVAKTTQAIIMAVLPALQCENTIILGSGGSFPVCDDVVCDCSDAVFSPICGSDGQSYYSACHAGCLSSNGSLEQESFLTNCSCILSGGFASASTCEIECPQKIGYLLLVAMSKLCLSVDVVAGTLFVLRCVEPRDKTIATGFLCSVLGIFTFIPCPIVFSAAVDSTCDVWGEQCGRAGACNVYDMDALRAVLHFVPAALIGISVIWDALFWWLSKDKMELFQDDHKAKVIVDN
uniref:Solute carrier organic anion transporter family member n=1 Tax=Strigamia maritima TaxID=126957 RepID=T1IV13_STRMM